MFMSNQSSVSLFPVLSAKMLLPHAKYRIFFEKLKKNCGLSGDQFSLLYQSLVEAFVEFVQALPTTAGGKPGGLMKEGLERAQLAFHYYWTEARGDDPLYAYMVFSAALLLDIGKVVSQQKVAVSDQQGFFIEEWIPYTGSLLEHANYYKLRFLDDRWVDLGKHVALLLAKQLMPELGFLWLSQNYAFLQMWLGVLSGEEGSERNPLSMLLQLIKQRPLAGQGLEELPLLAIEPVHAEESELGERFLAWLSEGLQDNKLAYNEAEAAIHGLKQNEIFLEWPKVAKLFDQRVDAAVLQRQLNYLGFTKLSGGDYKFEKYFAKYPDALSAERAITFLGQKPAAIPFKPGLPMIREGLVLNERINSMLNIQVVPSILLPVEAAAARPVVINSVEVLENLAAKNKNTSRLVLDYPKALPPS